MTANWKLYTST